MSARAGSETRATIWSFNGSEATRRSDHLATEEPLEIRLVAGSQRRTLAVTMRTPGSDFELVAGFLLAEGLVDDRAGIRRLSYCVDRAMDEDQRFNVVNAELVAPELPDLGSAARQFVTSSACGVCGKASLESLHVSGCQPVAAGPTVTRDVVLSLPDKLRGAQRLFSSTGGLHGAALFDTRGNPMVVREDVGRHNAMDKAIGWALLQGVIPLRDSIALVSGRVSFEIVQKCLVAGVPIVCAVSAPSSLAVALAAEFGITLIGFLRADRFNVYSAPERVSAPA